MQPSSSLISDPQSAPPAANGSSMKKSLPWLLSVLAIVVFSVLVFNRTIFRGADITAANYVAHLDTVFDTQLPEMWLPVVYDQTPQTILYPNERFFKETAAIGQLPLWNDKNACGIPLLGDFNAFVFSPLAWAKAYASRYVYNLILCGLVLVGSVMSLFVARRLGLAPLPSLFVALAFGFNPGVIRYTELHNNNFLVPIILLAVVSLGARSIWHSIALGVVCGIVPYIMHAECAFSAVAFSWLYLLVQVICEGKTEQRARPLKSFFASLSIAAVVGVALAMPILLPFVEFCTNSVCYKSVVDWVRDIQFPALVLNLVNPCCGGGSFFSGIVLPGLVVLGLCQKDPRVRALAIVALINGLLITRMPPFNWMLSSRPFNFFMPIYASTPFMLFLSLLGAYGLQEILSPSSGSASGSPASKITDNEKFKYGLSALTIVIASAIPMLFLALHVNLRPLQFDCFEVAINLKECYAQSLLAGLAAILLLLALNYNLFRTRILAPALVLVTLISMASSLKQALPITPAFDYKPTDLITYLQEHKGRVMGLGFHMLVPNLNEVYGIEDFRVTNPFMPARYLRYLEQMGGKREGLNEFRYSGKLGKELDMAGVKYIIAQPPLDKELTEPRFKLVKEFQGKIRLYENTQVLPQSYLVYQTQSVADFTAALDAMKAADFDPINKAVIEDPGSANLGSLQNSGTAEMKRVGPQTVEITARASAPAVLVLADSFYPGWKATVDGRESKIYPVNGMFRGVKLEAGEHKVVFQYKPRSLELGLIICASIAGLVLGLAIFNFFRRKK